MFFPAAEENRHRVPPAGQMKQEKQEPEENI